MYLIKRLQLSGGRILIKNQKFRANLELLEIQFLTT